MCLFYALHYQQGEGTAVVLRARFVRTRYEYADVPAEVRIIFEYWNETRTSEKVKEQEHTNNEER